MRPTLARLAGQVGLFSSISRRWAGPAVAGLADQALISGSNFLVAVLAGRWLGSEEYGSFGIAMSLYFVAFGLHQAFVEEPLMVLGAGARRHRGEVVGELLPLHMVIALGAGGALLGIAVLWPGSIVSSALTGLAAAAPAILHYSYLRRAIYIEQQYGLVVWGSIAYASAQLMTLAALRAMNCLGTMSVFLPMAAAGICGSAALRILGRSLPFAVASRESAISMTKEALRFGKWAAACQATYWGSTAIYGPLLAGMVGLQAAGAFRAHTNFALPLGQATTALSMIALPYLSRRSAESGIASVKGAVSRMTVLAGVVGGAYTVMVALVSRTVTAAVYKNVMYTSLAPVAVLLAAAQAVSGLRQSLYIAAKAMIQPKLVFQGQIVGACVTLTLGVALVLMSGVIGAGWGQFISNVAETAWLWWKVNALAKAHVILDETA